MLSQVFRNYYYYCFTIKSFENYSRIKELKLLLTVLNIYMNIFKPKNYIMSTLRLSTSEEIL